MESWFTFSVSWLTDVSSGDTGKQKSAALAQSLLLTDNPGFHMHSSSLGKTLKLPARRDLFSLQ